jgi:5-methylthioribose kinase
MIMEDLSDYQIMRYGLLEGKQYPKFAEQISDFLVKTLLLTSDVVLDHHKKKDLVKDFINPELCDITEDLVYTEPFFSGARNDFEHGILRFVENNIWNDDALKLEAAKLKFDFMNNAQALLHGDLHTGSIFVNQESTKVIDPEFAFYGPIAYDTGALVANLIMNYISADASFTGDLKEKHKAYMLNTLKDTVDLFIKKFLAIFDSVATDKMAKVKGFKEWYLNRILVDTAGVAGTEMIRRTVGFAQVKDLNSIENIGLRIKAKETNILIAKELIMSRETFITGSDYVNLIKRYF